MVFSLVELLAATLRLCLVPAKMPVTLAVSLLILATEAVAQLTGRGFPDCVNGPLKTNKVCDKSLGNNRFRAMH